MKAKRRRNYELLKASFDIFFSSPWNYCTPNYRSYLYTGKN